MIRYLIKNNFKIMFRSAANILMLIVAPLAVIAVLSSAFSALMERYEDVGSLKVGYRIVDEGLSEQIEDGLKKAATQQDILLIEYTEQDPQELVRSENLSGFVTFAKGSYTVYENEDLKGNGQALEYFLHAVYEQVALQNMEMTKALSSYQRVPEESLSDDSSETGEGSERITEYPMIVINDYSVVKADHMPAVDSTEYYGIIYIAYFSWCTIVCGAGLFSAEKKNRIGNKLRVSGITEFKAYLAKFIPLVLVVIAGMAVATGASIVLFGVHWGSPLWSFLLVVIGITAAMSFGLMIYTIFDNMVITVILVFMAVWTWGFLGGSFETYLFSEMSASIQHLSPIYYLNRSLIELSSMGESDYVWRSLAISGAMTVVCSALAVFAGTIRKRGKRA